ncbi:alpha/beta-hydrolase family protein [Nonomuraea monospora]|uniref:alpha/beta-hydrolase family protein n=1 Tax=Nonomuraea monospora TaxID=568818 RepID=UPI0031CF16DF
MRRAGAQALRRIVSADTGTVEAAGLLAAAGSVGPSFQPGLLPRTTRDQALITGVVASANYAFAATTQALAEAVARRLGQRLNAARGRMPRWGAARDRMPRWDAARDRMPRWDAARDRMPRWDAAGGRMPRRDVARGRLLRLDAARGRPLSRRDAARGRGGLRGIVADPRTTALVTQVCACGAGIALQRLAAQRPEEGLGRAAVRVFGWRLTAGGVAGALATAADAVADRLTGAPTGARINVAATLLAGAGVSAVLYARQRRAADIPAGGHVMRPADAPGGTQPVGTSDEPGGARAVRSVDVPGGPEVVRPADAPGGTQPVGTSDEPGGARAVRSVDVPGGPEVVRSAGVPAGPEATRAAVPAGARAVRAAGVAAGVQAVGVGTGVQVLQAVGVGTVVSASILAAARAEAAAAAALGRAVALAVPSLAPAERVAGHAITLALITYAARRAAVLAYRRIDSAGVVVEPAHQEQPTSPLVSGGPASLVRWADFGREGRRYVGMTLTAQEIAHVTGAQDARDPIRVFVGLASALTPGERADLAMRELERSGAFERSVLAYFSPTGSGYVNYVAAETLEYLTKGDVASIAIAYSVRPSFLSLDRVRAAWEENLAFLTALSWRLRSIDPARRPRLVLFGESLGSQAAQNVFLHQGARGLDLLGIDRALFVGTPFASAWRQAWLDDPEGCDGDGRVVEVASYEEWLALPEERRERVRVVLLTHHEDPVPKLGLPLLIQSPGWLGPVRGPGIPAAARWRPFVTALITFVDMLNAIHVVPGQFVSLGHDYRGDLARFVRLAFDLPADEATMAAVERALRDRELDWANRRVAGDKK